MAKSAQPDLLDQFALAALPALIVWHDREESKFTTRTPSDAAMMAYGYAEAMMAEREAR